MTRDVCCLIVCAIFLGSSLGQNTIPLSQDGDHVCTTTESFQDRRTISMMTAYETAYQTSCGIFQTCYRLRTVYRATYSFEYFVNYRNVTICCDGYVQSDDSCTPCSSDTWGSGCANQCQCENGATCDSVNGQCYCPLGYTGALCDSPCPPGKYGQNCSLTCNCPSSCQPEDGTCVCDPGYTGEGCNAPCPAGTFGQDCAGLCPICANGGSCDPVTGNCVCQGGFGGVHCTMIAQQSICNCTNGGYCDENVMGCVCPDGFQGERCESEALTILNCPELITVVNYLNSSEVAVQWDEPSASSANPPVTLVTQTHQPGDNFTRDSQSTVTYVYEDSAGVAAKCEFVVKVTEDNTPPVISNCPSDLSVTREIGVDQLTVSWSEPSATDDSSMLDTLQSKMPGDVFPLGTTTVNYTFVDQAGNADSCIFTITLTTVDTTPPVVLTCPSDIFVSVETGQGPVSVSWEPPTVMDLGGAVFQNHEFSPNDTFMVGDTEVVYTFIDMAGNLAFCNFTINVSELDTTPPQIQNCPSTQQAFVEVGTSNTEVTWPEPTVTDNSGFFNLVGPNHSPGEAYSVGVTGVTYKYEDSSGNVAFCNFTVVVISVDTVPPVIMNCDPTIEKFEVGTQSVNVTWTEPTASDLSGSPVIVNQSASPPLELKTNQMVHLVHYTFEDAAGNSAECDLLILLFQVDTVAPTISNCPTTVSAITELGTLSKAVTWDEITATDASGSVTEAHTHVSGETFPVGVTEVTLTFTDTTGNSAVCAFNVSVVAVDTTPPQFENCPMGQVRQVELGITNVVVTWEQIQVIDASPTNVISQNYFPGDRFPVGVTTVSILAEDSSGLRSFCNFTVEVVTVDTAPPMVFDCPQSDINETVESGETSAIVFWLEPFAIDLSSTRLQEQSHFPGDEFDLGVTKVTYVFEDESNNSAICQFSVNVLLVDTTPPEIMGCPENLVVDVETGTSETEVSWDEPTASDPSGVSLVSHSHQPPEVFPVGSETVVTYRFVDSFGIGNECSFIIRIRAVDTLSPVISGCPGDISEDLEAGLATKEVTWMEPTASDNGPMQPFLSTRTHSPGTAFPPGNTTVRYVFFDFSNNSASCVFAVIITVVDTEPPVVENCPENILGPTIELGSNGTAVTWSEPSSTDGSGNAVSLIGPSHRPGDIFVAGATLVTYRFVDTVGLESVCEFLVIVSAEDTTPPTVQNCPQSLTSTVELGVDGVAVEWEEPFAEDLSANVTLMSQNYSPGHFFLVGRVTVRYVFGDPSGNEAECSFDVTVMTVDTKPPVVAGCPDDVVVTVPHLSTYANVTWTEPTAQDLSGMVGVSSRYPEPGGRFEVGVTSVTYTFTDRSNNIASCIFSVTVQTDGPDQIVISNCPKDFEVETNPGSEVSVFWVEPSATNNAGTVSLSFRSHAPPVRLPVGETMVQYIFEDDMDSVAFCQFSVIVVEASVFVCPEVNITAVAPSDGNSMAVNWTSSLIGNDTGSLQVTYDRMSGDPFPIGATIVNYTMVDERTGASKDCTFMVIVFDVTPPEIFDCPTDITIGLPSGASSLAVTWREPVAEDNSDRVSVTKSSKPGDKFSIGSQTVVYRFSDLSGNINSCSFLISLTGDNAPFGNDFIVTLAASCGVILFAIFVVAVCLGSVCCCRSRSRSHQLDDDDIDLDDNYFNNEYNQGALTDVHYTNNGYQKPSQHKGDPQYDQPPSASNSIKRRESTHKSLERRHSHYSQTLPHRPIQDPLDQGTRTIKRAYNGPVPGTSTANSKLKGHPQLEVELHQEAVSALGQGFPPIPEELDNGEYLEIKYPSGGI